MCVFLISVILGAYTKDHFYFADAKCPKLPLYTEKWKLMSFGFEVADPSVLIHILYRTLRVKDYIKNFKM